MSVKITKSAFEDALGEQFGPVSVLKRKNETKTNPMYLYYIDDDRGEDPANAGHCGTWINGMGHVIGTYH
tara:strand:+ start:518 stop:727 length:210 start_codon:yes stop_codon:yes gene_type:complete